MSTVYQFKLNYLKRIGEPKETEQDSTIFYCKRIKISNSSELSKRKINRVRRVLVGVFLVYVAVATYAP